MIGYLQDCPAYLRNGYLQDGPAYNKCVFLTTVNKLLNYTM